MNNEAIPQAFRILSQFDIPKGAVINPIENHQDETLYTSVMDTSKLTYCIKCHNNITIQAFHLADYQNQEEIQFIELRKDFN